MLTTVSRVLVGSKDLFSFLKSVTAAHSHTCTHADKHASQVNHLTWAWKLWNVSVNAQSPRESKKTVWDGVQVESQLELCMQTAVKLMEISLCPDCAHPSLLRALSFPQPLRALPLSFQFITRARAYHPFINYDITQSKNVALFEASVLCSHNAVWDQPEHDNDVMATRAAVNMSSHVNVRQRGLVNSRAPHRLPKYNGEGLHSGKYYLCKNVNLETKLHKLLIYDNKKPWREWACSQASWLRCGRTTCTAKGVFARLSFINSDSLHEQGLYLIWKHSTEQKYCPIFAWQFSEFMVIGPKKRSSKYTVYITVWLFI